jgi:hypothetical protein
MTTFLTIPLCEGRVKDWDNSNASIRRLFGA